MALMVELWESMAQRTSVVSLWTMSRVEFAFEIDAMSLDCESSRSVGVGTGRYF